MALRVACRIRLPMHESRSSVSFLPGLMQNSEGTGVQVERFSVCLAGSRCRALVLSAAMPQRVAFAAFQKPPLTQRCLSVSACAIIRLVYSVHYDAVLRYRRVDKELYTPQVRDRFFIRRRLKVLVRKAIARERDAWQVVAREVRNQHVTVSRVHASYACRFS